MDKRSKEASTSALPPPLGGVQILNPSWLSQAMDIERLSYTTPWPQAAMQQSLSQPQGNLGWVHKKNLYGYLIYRCLGNEAEVLNLAVHPQYRRLGIAQRLLQEFHIVARHQAVIEIHLEVARQNHAAQKLYEGFGYRQVGSRRAYYHDTGDDALLYRCNL